MSEHPDQTPTPEADGEQEWPTHCDACGTELESAVVQAVPNAESEHLQTASPASVVVEDFCPNPECPAKAAGQVPEGLGG